MTQRDRPKLPLLGALVGPGRDPLAMFQRYARQYGDVTFFKLGAERCYFVNHPNFIKDVLVTHQRNFTKSRGLERARKLLGDGLLTAEGDLAFGGLCCRCQGEKQHQRCHHKETMQS